MPHGQIPPLNGEGCCPTPIKSILSPRPTEVLMCTWAQRPNLILLFQDDQTKQQSVSEVTIPARRQSSDREDTQTNIDARLLRSDAVDHGTGTGGSGETRSASTRPRRRRRSMHALTADHDMAWLTSSRIQSRRSLTATPDTARLSDDLRASTSQQSRRFSHTSSTHERFTPATEMPTPFDVADSSTMMNCNTALTDAPLRLQLQAKVKVSERPVRCLVNSR